MNHDIHHPDRAQAAANILQNFFDAEVDPIEIERLLNEMLLHFLRPTNDWNLTKPYALRALDHGEILTRLLQQIGEYQKGSAV